MVYEQKIYYTQISELFMCAFFVPHSHSRLSGSLAIPLHWMSSWVSHNSSISNDRNIIESSTEAVFTTALDDPTMLILNSQLDRVIFRSTDSFPLRFFGLG